MFRLPPIRLWRNCSLALFGLGACAALTGTVLIRGKLAIHFDGAGIPNGFAEKWVLWGLLAMAFFSLFTSAGFSKKPALGRSPFRRRRLRPVRLAGGRLLPGRRAAGGLPPVSLCRCPGGGFALIVGALPLFLLAGVPPKPEARTI